MSIALDVQPKGVRRTISRFKEVYPELLRRGINYEPYDHMAITVYIPGRGKLIYEYFGDRITWLEHWTDEKEEKEKDRAIRSEMYEQFRIDITEYLKERKITQQQFADMVGLSRWSLGKYLNGEQTPKVSTMRHVYNTMGIEM